MANIVLAHGILGFGSVIPNQPLNYFNGIKQLYDAAGHKAECPGVAPLGSLEGRAAHLESEIIRLFGDNDEPLFLLAHSMGGLDCRRVIATSARLKGRIRRLVTIATPHYGSPVADAVLSPFGALTQIGLFDKHTGALKDLRTRDALQDPNDGAVDYVCIGCDHSRSNPRSPLFVGTELIGRLTGTPNDGVVSLASASHTNSENGLSTTWELDHGEAIGWPSQTLALTAQAAVTPPPAHIARYQALLPNLIA